MENDRANTELRSIGIQISNLIATNLISAENEL